MDKKEYKEKMELLKQQLESTNKQIEELQNLEIEEDIDWQPKLFDEYWFIDDNVNAVKCQWITADFDYKRFNIYNVFKTKGKAEFELNRRKVIAELKRFSNDFKQEIDSFFIAYDYLNDYIVIHCDNIYKHSDIYFESEDKAWRAVETVGRDRVVKYYLGIEEK